MDQIASQCLDPSRLGSQQRWAPALQGTTCVLPVHCLGALTRPRRENETFLTDRRVGLILDKNGNVPGGPVQNVSWGTVRKTFLRQIEELGVRPAVIKNDPRSRTRWPNASQGNSPQRTSQAQGRKPSPSESSMAGLLGVLKIGTSVPAPVPDGLLCDEANVRLSCARLACAYTCCLMLGAARLVEPKTLEYTYVGARRWLIRFTPL